MSLKYSLGLAITIPLLPLLFIQGRRVKNSIPELPEAKGTSGDSGLSNHPAMRILIIGESTMAGVGVENHKDGFAGALGDELAVSLDQNVFWHVYAKSGITANRVSKELLIKIDKDDWDLIVIGLGGNDAFGLNSPGKWKIHTRQLITDIKNRFENVPIVFTNMPPIKEFPAFTPLMKWTIGNLVELLGDALKDVVGEFDQVYYSSDIVSVESWSSRYNLSSDISLYFSDGVHPSQLTYQTLARQLVEFIASNVRIGKITISS